MRHREREREGGGGGGGGGGGVLFHAEAVGADNTCMACQKYVFVHCYWQPLSNRSMMTCSGGGVWIVVSDSLGSYVQLSYILLSSV